MKRVFLPLVVFAAFACAQVTTSSTLDGTVEELQGALVSSAQILVVNVDNGRTFKATADDHGHWVISAVPAGSYRVTVTMAGFRTLTMPGVKVDASSRTLPAALRLGARRRTTTTFRVPPTPVAE